MRGARLPRFLIGAVMCFAVIAVAPKAETPVLLHADDGVRKAPVQYIDRTPPVSRSKTYTSIEQLPKVWQRLAYCESRYQQFAVSPSGLHHGYFQIHKGFFITKDVDWKTATLQQQWEVAQYVYKRQGARAWSCAKEAGLT